MLPIKQGFLQQPRKKARRSLNIYDPDKILHFVSNFNATETNMCFNNQSQSSIAHSHQTLQQQHHHQAFDAIANKRGVIDSKCLKIFLQDQGQTTYTGIQMISYLDQNKKGYVTKEQFMNFCQHGEQVNEPQLPQQLQRDRKWIALIEQNYQLFKRFSDKQFCQFAANQIKKASKKEQQALSEIISQDSV